MHPARQAEETLLRLRDDQPQNIRTGIMEEAAVCSMLAIAQAIEGLGHDIREGAKDIAVELGSLAIATGEEK